MRGAVMYGPGDVSVEERAALLIPAAARSRTARTALFAATCSHSSTTQDGRDTAHGACEAP